jgi:hypothetical protein
MRTSRPTTFKEEAISESPEDRSREIDKALAVATNADDHA